jgi:hypothetical protein
MNMATLGMSIQLLLCYPFAVIVISKLKLVIPDILWDTARVKVTCLTAFTARVCPP